LAAVHLPATIPAEAAHSAARFCGSDAVFRGPRTGDPVPRLPDKRFEVLSTAIGGAEAMCNGAATIDVGRDRLGDQA